MKLGVENKRNLVILTLLGLGAVYGIYSNFSDSSSTPAPKNPVTAAEQPAIGAPAGESGQPAPPRPHARNEEWHPVVVPKSKEDQVDPSKVDPTLHLDLLAKVQAAKPAGGGRNLFEFGAPKPAGPVTLAGAEPVVKGPTPMGPAPLPPPPGPPQPPPEKPLPPLNAKYYGYASPSHSGRRRGFFMDGEDILIKAEGEILIGHYKIVKLDAGSVVVQDTDSKRTKTLQMEQDASD